MDFYDLGTFVASVLLFMLFMLVVAVVFIILDCAAHYKAYRILGYHSPAAAWVPFWGLYALPDLVAGDNRDMPFLGMRIPAGIFKWYWAVAGGAMFVSSLFIFVPVAGSIASSIINIAMAVFCCLVRGVCYGYVYAALEGRSYEECQAVGILSGFIPIIATVKLLAAKG